MKKLILVLTLSLINTHFSWAQKNEWSVKMKKMNNTLGQLLTYTSSHSLFSDPKNFKKIESELKDLAQLSHGLKMKETLAAHPDPAVRIFADDFDSYVNEAYVTYKAGHRDYAKQVISSVTQACVNCHSRTDAGVRFGDLPNSKLTQELKGVDLATYLSATRQFDSALKQYQDIVASQEILKKNVWEWQEALNQGLALAIKVKKDPSVALGFVEQALKLNDVPFYVKQNAKEWKVAILQWQDDWKKKRPTSDTELFDGAKQLIARAKNIQQHSMDHAGDVDYLLASALLYELLEKSPQYKKLPEVLFMTGVSLEAVSPRAFDHLPRVFYEECIRKSPHSSIAQSCYTAYEQQVYFAFSGSAGLDLPLDVKAKLNQLKKLATQTESELPKVQ